MSVRSIIDVDVQSAAFDRFTQEFDKYSEALRKQPDLWRRVAAEHSKLATGFAKLGNQMDAHFGAADELKEVEKDQEKTLTHSASLWEGIERSSGHTAKNVIGATTSLLKWTGLLSGVAGLLGYFTLGGIEDLGQNAFNWRKSAAGLGLTTGQQRAFDISFARLLGSPEGFLGGINQAVTNYAAQGPLYALGVNPNQSTSQVAISTLQALRGRVAGMSIPMLGQFEQAYGLGALGISVEDLRRLQSMSGPQFSQLLGTYRKQQSALNLSDQTTLAWTNFITGLDLAKAKIENVFVKGLTPLSGPLKNLAAGFATMLQTIMSKNGTISQDIEGIAKWMKDFNGKITKPEFVTGLQNFADLIGTIGAGIGKTGDAAKWLFNHSPAAVEAKAGAWAYVNGGSIWGDIKSFFSNPVAAGATWQRTKWFQLANQMDPSGLLGTVGWLESGMNSQTPDSARGAKGIMQIMPAVARAAGINPYDPEQSLAWANQQLRRLSQEYHGDIAKELAAYNWGEGNVNRDIAQYGSNWQQHLPPETMNYLAKALAQALGGSIKVKIVNATGGSATASVSALGATR